LPPLIQIIGVESLAYYNRVSALHLAIIERLVHVPVRTWAAFSSQKVVLEQTWRCLSSHFCCRSSELCASSMHVLHEPWLAVSHDAWRWGLRLGGVVESWSGRAGAGIEVALVLVSHSVLVNGPPATRKLSTNVSFIWLVQGVCMAVSSWLSVSAYCGILPTLLGSCECRRAHSSRSCQWLLPSMCVVLLVCQVIIKLSRWVAVPSLSPLLPQFSLSNSLGNSSGPSSSIEFDRGIQTYHVGVLGGVEELGCHHHLLLVDSCVGGLPLLAY